LFLDGLRGIDHPPSSGVSHWLQPRSHLLGGRRQKLHHLIWPRAARSGRRAEIRVGDIELPRRSQSIDAAIDPPKKQALLLDEAVPELHVALQ